ncbi:HD-GYP domain-containing protein [Methylobacterium sp. D48H]
MAAQQLLLISDDLRRGERLARDLVALGACQVHDLYADASPDVKPSLVISDVQALTSDAILRLRQCLAHARKGGAPYLFLVHGNPARAEAQARLLGASQTLGASSAARMMIERLNQLSTEAALLPPATLKRAIEARQFLKDTVFSEQPITPDLADLGTDLIERALREANIRDWIRAVQQFDDITHQHMLLVAGLSAAFAAALGFGTGDRHRVIKAALLHDVGKTKIPLTILNKPGRLDDAELKVMRTHAAEGHTLLLNGGFDAATLAVVRSHHEMLDGSGYPDGLAGKEIPDLVRLITVCDIYAALIERRPYKAPMPAERALAILEDMTGRLDADLVRTFRPVAKAQIEL